MDRDPVDLYALDALANDVEGFEDVVRLVNHPSLGWQKPYGGPISEDAVLSALQRLVTDGLVAPLLLDASGTTLEAITPGIWPSGESAAALWFQMTPEGRQVHTDWEP